MLAAAKEETFSPSMVWSGDGVLPLAADLCVETRIAPTLRRGTKPHQGVAGKNLALHQGIMWSNSTTALGLRGLERETRVRSRCTGKERDPESDLDYSLTRYFASVLGRFTSSDFANVAGDLDESGNPQSWNAYTYVRNNPLSVIDPNGEDCIYVDADDPRNSYIVTGDCISDTDNGIFVNGTIKSFTYNSVTGNIDFSGTNYAGDPASIISGRLMETPTDPATNLANAVNADNPGGFINGSMIMMGSNAVGELAGQLAGLGLKALLAARDARLAAEAAEAAEAAVDLENLSNKIVRQMLERGWTKSEILDTVQNGKAYDVINKATGGPATEYINPTTGKFVVVDNATQRVLQVSGPGFLPNHLAQ